MSSRSSATTGQRGTSTTCCPMLAVRAIERFLGEGRDVFAHLNNDAHGHAVRGALELKRLLGDVGPSS